LSPPRRGFIALRIHIGESSKSIFCGQGNLPCQEPYQKERIKSSTGRGFLAARIQLSVSKKTLKG
jgi:hypothetical protein